jgi:hypothetical protein
MNRAPAARHSRWTGYSGKAASGPGLPAGPLDCHEA